MAFKWLVNRVTNHLLTGMILQVSLYHSPLGCTLTFFRFVTFAARAMLCEWMSNPNLESTWHKKDISGNSGKPNGWKYGFTMDSQHVIGVVFLPNWIQFVKNRILPRGRSKHMQTQQVFEATTYRYVSWQLLFFKQSSLNFFVFSDFAAR